MRLGQLIKIAVLFSWICGVATSPVYAVLLESSIPFFTSSSQAPRATLPSLPEAADPKLQKNVDFWVQIYGKYYSYEGLLHDSRYIEIVYETVNLEGLDPRQAKKLVKERKVKWREVLTSLQRKQKKLDSGDLSSLTEDEKRVFQMFTQIDEPNKYLAAAHRKRLRLQVGQKDKFLAGLYESGRYLPIMESIFEREGMPKELTRLPFVESSFNVKARSRVGASGIWQFMRSTGRSFLKIDDAVDERNDPIRATEAAAKLLRVNYEALGAWPLAVTAYNHGREGMLRAVRKVGSQELVDLIAEYRSRLFGFASSNFYTELLAAIEVERNSEKYFGKVERAPGLRAIEVTIPDYVVLPEMAKFLKLDLERVQELNPGLNQAVFKGDKLIPQGYRLRLPHSGDDEPEMAESLFWAGYVEIPDSFKFLDRYARQSRLKYGPKRDRTLGSKD